MAEYRDMGQYIMKLFDELIAVSKEQMNESTKTFCREFPRRVRTSMTAMQGERFVREMAEQLIRINQDLLNQYAISIAKKARSASKTQSQTLEGNYEELQQLLAKKEEEVEGLQAQIQQIEQRNKNLEEEKEETLKQLSQMNTTIGELESRLANTTEEFSNQITQLNADWETKFQQNQEEWDSYVKLKLAEREVTEREGISAAGPSESE